MDSEIIRRYWAGEPRFLLKEEFGDRVDDVMREAGGSLPREITRSTYDRAEQLINAGVRVGEMHRNHGIRQDVINRHFSWYKGARIGISAETMSQMQALVYDGVSSLEISKRFGMHQSKIRKLFPKSVWTKKQAGELGGVVSAYTRKGVL